MIEFREELSAPGLWLAVKDYFCRRVDDQRSGNGNTEIPVPSALLSACAMFALKYPSLLQFDQGRVDATVAHNLKHLFHACHTPSDTHMREIIDKLDPEQIEGALDLVFAKAQRGKVLESYKFLDHGYLLSIDGTGYFASEEVHCESCCVKEKASGKRSYYHMYLPGVVVHPDQRQVIPLAAEPMLKQDGSTKNDSEFLAAHRLLKKIRKNHPKLRLTILADSLHSNTPMVKIIRELGMDFIITAKEGNHEALFQQLRMFDSMDKVTHVQVNDEEVHRSFRFKNGVWLNSGSDQKVNVLEFWEWNVKTQVKRHWAWVTSIEITKDNVMSLMRGARARWKIENETFNTLKNQNYHFEHNFGHGYKNLSTNFALLMLLAFAVDQVQEFTCKVFQKAKEICHSRVVLWETMRSRFTTFMFNSWNDFFHSIIYKKTILYDSS